LVVICLALVSVMLLSCRSYQLIIQKMHYLNLSLGPLGQFLSSIWHILNDDLLDIRTRCEWSMEKVSWYDGIVRSLQGVFVPTGVDFCLAVAVQHNF